MTRKDFRPPDRRDWHWVSWVVFAVGLFLICYGIGHLLLAVADAR